MAQFEGTIAEFMRFIGPHARILVWNITQKHRKMIGKCEECGSVEKLEAAHAKGKERPLLISNILNQFLEGEIIRIDLNEFEERFKESHLPIESTIRILCNSCHKIYDKSVIEQTIGSLESIENNENEIVEKLIFSQMNKAKAMKIAYTKNLTTLTNTNTIFSNIIAVQNGWWLQPSNDKFKQLLHIVLNDSRSNQLYVLRLPANIIKNPGEYFKQRNDKYRANCSDIYIPTSGTKFKEKNGFDFSEYLIEKIEYQT